MIKVEFQRRNIAYSGRLSYCKGTLPAYCVWRIVEGSLSSVNEGCTWQVP